MKQKMHLAMNYLRKNKVASRLLSAFLCAVLVFYVIPSTIYSKAAELLDDNTAESVETVNSSVPAVYEIEELRERNAKHFRLEDGSFVIAKYNDNIHYLDENGKWADIDNTVSSSLTGYTVPNSAVTFVKKTTGNGKLYTVKENDNKITVYLKDAEKGVKATVINGSDTEDMTEKEKAINLEKTVSRVVYYDIQENTDIEYVLHGTDLKENIIVKDIRDSYVYEFELKLKDLVANLDDNGNVIISDEDTSEIKYIIPAPIVYDSLGQMPSKEQAYYTLDGKGNKYILTVTVDQNWMNSEDTIFPVVIDPTIEAPDVFLVEDTSGGDTGNSELLYVKKNSNAFWRMVNMPEIPDAAHLTKVTLNFPYHSASGHFTPSLMLRKVQSAWSESNGIEGVVIANTIESIAYIENSNQGLTYTFDITELFHSWYEDPTTNFGVAIGYYNLLRDAFNLDITTRLYSSESTMNSLHFTYPSMVIGYDDTAGIEEKYSYASQNAGYGGAGHINLAAGSLNWQIPTISTTSALLSYTPTLVYNSYLSNIDYTAGNADAAYSTSFTPIGFKLNMSETIVVKDYYNISSKKYMYEDPDGTRYVLSASDTEENVYYDTDGLNMKFVVSSDFITLTDDSHLTKTFVKTDPDAYPHVLSAWCLSEVTDEYGNKLIFTLDSLARPTEILLNPVGATQSIVLLKLIYGNENRLSMIYNPTTMDAVILRYSETYDGIIADSGGKYLKQIEFTVGKHEDTNTTTLSDLTNYCNNSEYTQNIVVANASSYIYNEDGKLTKIIDVISDKYIEYTWCNDNVTGVAEGSGNDIGQSISISYNADCTTVRSSGNDDIILNDDDTLTRYIFDEKGRTVSLYSCSLDGSEIYGAKAGAYDDESRENNLKHQSVLGGSFVNYLLNGDFEEYDGNTYPKYWNYSNASRNVVYPDTGFGYNAIKLAPSSTSDSFISQVVFLPEGSYTLSMIYSSMAYDGYDATASIISTVGSGLNVTENIALSGDGSSEKVVFSTSFEVSNFTNGGDYAEIKITLSCDTFNQFSSLKIDNIMLCDSEGASDYSFVTYGSFDATSYGDDDSLIALENYWSSSSADAFEYTYVTDTPEFGNVLKIKKSTEETLVKQRIYQINSFDLTYYNTQDFVSNIYNDYIVSGFAYAPTAISADDSSSTFRIGIDVYYYQGPNESDVVKTFYFDFLPGIDGWQFISGLFSTIYAPEETDTNRYDCVSAIDIFCEYSNQMNCDAYFDNISVIRADIGNYTEYYYYNEGSEKGLPAVVRSGSYYEYYMYDEHKNLTVSATSEGNMTMYGYDSNNVYQLNTVTQCKYSYEGVYVLPINLDDPIGALTVYYRSKTTYAYDQYGNNTEVSTCPINAYEDTVNSSLKTYSALTYDVRPDSVMFGSILSETDETGAITYYYYDEGTCRLRATANSVSGNGLVYSYDEKGALSSVTPGSYVSPTSFTEITDAECVEYTYNEDNLIDEISTATTNYSFTYDTFGNRVNFKVGDKSLAAYEYAENNGKLKKVIYGNGFVVEYVYNPLEMLKEIWYNNSDGVRIKAYEYEYTADGQISSVKDNINAIRTEYTYDSRNRVSRITTAGHSDMYNDLFTHREFHEDGKLHYTSTHVNILNGTDYDDTYISYFCYYNDDVGDLRSYALIGRHVLGGLSFTYDEFARVSELSHSMESFDADYSYTYKNYGEYTTGLIESVTTVINETTTKSESYTYDANGNITKIVYSDGNVITYAYDDLGQLISENNDVTGYIRTYTYDNAGNIIKTTKRRQSTAADDGVTIMSVTDESSVDPLVVNPLLPPVTTNTYSYTDSDWGDLLTAYNGTTITYDEIGNPLSYYNGSSYTFTWNGRRLATAVKGTNTMSFTYNSDGLRTSKTVNGVTTNYYYQGSLLVAEEKNSSITVYYYDQNGAPIGYQYHGADYAKDQWDFFAFEKNIFGDVVAVYDGNGTKIVSYTYNAWGICTTSGTTSSAASDNPYRYRGYYYDKDLGMYYLQSRYYDPAICRFISADDYEYLGANCDLIGYNLYAYCSNNPVNHTDPTGHFILSAVVAGAIAGLILGFVATVIADYADDGEVFNESIGAGGYVTNSLVTFAAGAVMGILAPSIGSFLANNLSSGFLVTEGAGTVGIAVSSTALVAGVSTVVGIALFASDKRPGDNKKQNEQFRAVMREYKITDKDVMRRIHDKLKGKNFGYKQLLEFVREFLNLP